ncbi:MAG: exosortase O [Acidobacteriota bacterium]
MGLLTWALWLVAFGPSLARHGATFRYAEGVNLAVLGAALFVVVARAPKLVVHVAGFRPHPEPLLWILGAVAVDAAARLGWGDPRLSIVAFVVGGFGLLGTFTVPSRWRPLRPAALLVACVLPFGAQFGTGLGYPARVLTAAAVADVLGTLGVASLSAHDVVLLENGVAHVDLPCSGVKSLWTGTLFFLGATLVTQRRLGVRWLLSLGIFQGALLMANTARVLVLVILGLVLGAPRAADLAHVPLGIFGFAVCLGIGAVLVRWIPLQGQVDDAPPPSRAGAPLRPLLLLCCLVATLSAMPRIAEGGTRATAEEVVPPADIAASALEMTPAERRFFAYEPGTRAGKWRFRWGGARGSLLLVAADSWRSHHAPELCLAAAGFRVEAMGPRRLDGFPFHELQVSADGSGARTAAYWFQSTGGATPSLLQRFWREATRGDEGWVLVSVLFDPDSDPALHDPFLRHLHHHVDRRFDRRRPPWRT